MQHSRQAHIGRPRFFAVTFERMIEFGNDLPMIVYSLTGFIGGLPSTVNPKMLVRSPFTGIVSFNCCSFTRSPYETLLPPPADTTPSLTESLSFATPSLLRRQIQQSLVGVRRRLADIRRAVVPENRTRRSRLA